jgi:ferredoxin
LGKIPEFYVDADLCTECGDCITAITEAFRKVAGEELAEVYNTNLDESYLPKLEKIVADCPAAAILWKK